MPMKLGLELMAVVGSDLANTKREGPDDVVNEVDGACLGVFLVDFERSHPGRVINGGKLKTAYLLVSFSFECQELDVHLNVVTGYLFVVSLGVHLAQTGTARQTIDAVALKHPRDRGV